MKPVNYNGIPGMQAALASAEGELNGIPRQQKAAALEKLEQAQHALQLVERRAESSASHQAQAHAKELKVKLQQAQAELQGAQALQAELQGKAEVRHFISDVSISCLFLNITVPAITLQSSSRLARHGQGSAVTQVFTSLLTCRNSR